MGLRERWCRAPPGAPVDFQRRGEFPQCHGRTAAAARHRSDMCDSLESAGPLGRASFPGGARNSSASTAERLTGTGSGADTRGDCKDRKRCASWIAFHGHPIMYGPGTTTRCAGWRRAKHRPPRFLSCPDQIASPAFNSKGLNAASKSGGSLLPRREIQDRDGGRAHAEAESVKRARAETSFA
jgi:hypothetical protein